MHVERLAIEDLICLTPKRHGDDRGWFVESFNQRVAVEAGITVSFVQDNRAFSGKTGTLRGLHFQSPPQAQSKLVSVLKGSIFDVGVDIRRGSPTFGRWAGVRLDAAEGRQLFVPAGFAHGYCTLEPDTEVFYKVDAFYSREHDHGVSWDDPAIGIDWPLPLDQVILSEKDQRQPVLADLPEYFR